MYFFPHLLNFWSKDTASSWSISVSNLTEEISLKNKCLWKRKSANLYQMLHPSPGSLSWATLKDGPITLPNEWNKYILTLGPITVSPAAIPPSSLPKGDRKGTSDCRMQAMQWSKPLRNPWLSHSENEMWNVHDMKWAFFQWKSEKLGVGVSKCAVWKTGWSKVYRRPALL